jgi:hypothetical protein
LNGFSDWAPAGALLASKSRFQRCRTWGHKRDSGDFEILRRSDGQHKVAVEATSFIAVDRDCICIKLALGILNGEIRWMLAKLAFRLGSARALVSLPKRRLHLT